MISHVDDPIYSVAHDGDTVFLARQSGIYRSRDGGGTFLRVWSGEFATCVAVVGTNQIVIAGVPGGITRSSDGGESWEVTALGIPSPVVVAISADGEGPVFAATMEDGFFRSVDGGVSWRSANVGLWLPRMTAICAGDSSSVVAATEVGVVFSTNAGLSWDDAVGIGGSVSALVGVGEVVVAGTEGGEVFVSRSGGASWTAVGNVPGGVAVLELGLVGEDVIVLTEDGVWRAKIVGDELGLFDLVVAGDFVAGSVGEDGTIVVVDSVGMVREWSGPA